MSRYAGYTLGEITFPLDGTEVVIKPTIEDRRKILIILAKNQEQGYADIKEMESYLYTLLWESLPKDEKTDETAKELREFVLSKLTNLWIEIQIQFKLANREEIENLRKDLMEQLKKKVKREE